MRKLVMIFFCLAALPAVAQELYVFTDPASNIPAKTIGVRTSGMFMGSIHDDRLHQRYGTDISVGLSKKLMISGGLTFSNMERNTSVHYESVRLYAKWRFLSRDAVHKHFRMAAFVRMSHSQNPLDHDEINLMGEQSGTQAGIIATQLIHKLAVSGSLSYTQVLTPKPKFFPEAYPYQSFNYSLSAGYLVLPRQYKDYRQTNLNLYCELLGMYNTDKQKYALDIAPALQLIFNSNTRVNLGGRFQVSGTMFRMGTEQYFASVEYYFLNAFK
jgi:hypothetical protein